MMMMMMMMTMIILTHPFVVPLISYQPGHRDLRKGGGSQVFAVAQGESWSTRWRFHRSHLVFLCWGNGWRSHEGPTEAQVLRSTWSKYDWGKELTTHSTTQRQPLEIVDVPLILGQEALLLLIEQKPWWLCILSESEWMLKFVSPSTIHGLILDIQSPQPADALLFKGTLWP